MNDYIDYCDTCKKQVNLNDVFHFSGFINSVFSNHIQVCKHCFSELIKTDNLINIRLEVKDEL